MFFFIILNIKYAPCWNERPKGYERIDVNKITFLLVVKYTETTETYVKFELISYR